MNNAITLSASTPVINYSRQCEKWGRNLLLSLSLATGSIMIFNTNSVEAGEIPVCISYIPEEYGTLSLELLFSLLMFVFFCLK